MIADWSAWAVFGVGFIAGWLLRGSTQRQRRGGWDRQPKVIPGHVVGDVGRRAEAAKAANRQEG